MSAEQLRDLYQTADLIINLHGGTKPLPEHSASGRLVLLETDPVALEVKLHNQDEKALAFLEVHAAVFTWGLNYGQPDCRVPLDPRARFRPTCPPVILDFWEGHAHGAGELFTTVGNWRQNGTVSYQGETYHWSKDREFRKVLDLPERLGQRFELALNRDTRTDDDVLLLTGRGWRVRDGFASPGELDSYRQYICRSRGELTVAKDQNVRLRSGWFSERSACYLAAGRPVVTQDTGFGRAVPVGAGLFPFTTTEDIVAAVGEIEADYDRHSRAARRLAEEYFRAETVLSQMLRDLDV
jgi:glycosyltransferase involved in cell wall biosynthesis